jgi:hypothetical protein
MLSATLFRDDFDPENAYIPEAACDNYIWRIILVANEGPTLRTSTNHREGNSEKGFNKHFQK